MDYTEYVAKYGGCAIGSSIDKYSYIACRHPIMQDSRFHLVYSEEEFSDSVADIKHRVIKATIEFTGFEGQLELVHLADCGSQLGLGSSSSFLVCLLHSIYTLQNKFVSPKKLAQDAIHIEQNILGDRVGSQDQILAAYGGLSYIEFSKSGDFSVYPLRFHPDREHDLQDSLLLFFTGTRRVSGEVIKSYGNRDELHQQQMRIAELGLGALHCGDLPLLGSLVGESWRVKKALSAQVSNPFIDEVYELSRTYGSWGGKLNGAGAGGTMLLLAPKDNHQRLIYELTQKGLVHIPFRFASGSEVLLN